MVSSTDPELFYIKLYYKSEKVHGTFGLGCEKQGPTRDCTEKNVTTFKDLAFSLKSYLKSVL